MLDVLAFLKKRERPAEIKHMAISIKGLKEWSQKNEKQLAEALSKRNSIIFLLTKLAVERNIPVVTFYLSSDTKYGKEETDEPKDISLMYSESMNELFRKLKDDEMVAKNKIKISVIGKWYSLPGMVVESIKSMIEKTRDYDGFFLNFCVNYGGKEEIIDAFRLVYKGISESAIKEEPNINADMIKENAYSSYFIPPEIIIETGTDHRFSGLLLWDSVNARIFFIEKYFPDIEMDDIIEIIERR